MAIWDLVVKWQALRIPVVVILVDNCISPVCYFFNTYSHWHILIYDDEYTYSVVKITRFVGSGFSGLGG